MEYLVKPWKHQLEAIEIARHLKDYALFFECGTGKTATAINILRCKFNRQLKVGRTLVVCPPIVIQNWRDEWLTHSNVDPRSVVTLSGTGKRRLKKFNDQCIKEYSGGRIVITNYESLLMPDLYSAITKWRPEYIIYDESQRVKNPQAKRSKLAYKLANPRHKLPAEVLLLSGTPVLNSPMDIFQQYKIMDGGDTFGNNFMFFRDTYFYDRNKGMPKHLYFPDWVIHPNSIEKMNALIFKKASRVTKDEALDLPPLVQKTIRVDMSPQQKAAYDSMKKDFIAFIDTNKGKKATYATLGMTKALRLQQIVSGYAKVEDGNEIVLEATPKLKALKEMLIDLTPNHKVLVWATWRNNYVQLRKVCQDINVQFVEVHGDIPTGIKHNNVSRFNTNDDIRVLIGHPGSAGLGINLVSSDVSIFYSRSFSLEHSLQAEARNHRGGSEIHKKITRIDIVVGGTIDELVQQKLASKKQIGDSMLENLVEELKNEEN
jgi:SNF2 family DNA or RNA helicase